MHVVQYHPERYVETLDEATSERSQLWLVDRRGILNSPSSSACARKGPQMNRGMMIVGLLLFVAGARSAEPLKVGTDKQLFIDDRFIERSKGVERVVNPPRSTGEKLIVVEHPWEDFWIGGYTSVIQEGDRIHLWYATEDQRKGGGVGYACSTNGGAAWTKPKLGVIDYQGSRENNLVATGRLHGVTVFPNRPGAPANERYGMFSGNENKAFYSRDGIRWTATGKQPFLNLAGHHDGLDSQNVIFWDRRLEKYVAYPRINTPNPLATGPKSIKIIRTVGRTESSTFGNFPKPEIVFAADKDDPANVDFYTSAAIQYPFAADAYFMFPAAYYYSGDGPLDIQFAASRDSVRWLRPDRRPIIRLASGQKCLYAGDGLSRHNDELSLYYTSFPMEHGKIDTVTRVGTITRAIYRLDGFMSVDASYSGGEFTTPPLIFSGDRLEINFDGSAGGQVRVEIRDAEDRPIGGYREAECVLITGASVARLVHWQGKTDVTALKGKPVRLRFVMRDTKLYAFQFAGVASR